MTYRAIDCQGFAGGFTLGVAQAGFQLVGKREMQGGFGVPNCEANRHLLGDAWQTEAVNPDEWTVPAGGANLVFGNPPCSGFSVLSSKAFRGVDSKINACMWAFSNYAAKVVPEIAIFESVQLAYSQGHSLMTSLVANLNEKTGKTYHLTHVLHNAYSVGGPAMRRRYFWVASQVPFGVERVAPKRLPLFGDVIRDLEPQPLSWEAKPYAVTGEWPGGWYSDRFRSSSGTVDGHMALDNPLTRRVLELLEDGDWQPGEHSQAVTRRYFERHGKLPSTWEHMTDKLVKQDFFQGYNTPTMWNPDHPARVITGAGLLNGVHYSQRRNFTHREAARILGFPDDWRIEPLRGNPGLFMTWGKGITVDCGRWIARWASRALDGEPGEYLGEQVGENERVIDVTNLWKNCDTVAQSATRILKKFAKITGTPRENIVTEVPVAEATETPKSKGRPRPDETKARDEQVFAAIAGSERPVTRDEVATGAGLEPKLTYLSLWRLRKAGRIERTHADGKHVWGVVKVPTEAV